MLSLGVFGTAKNTGKTVVFNASLRCLWGWGSVALTSVGFDGEDLDHVTGLPKPKVVVDEGALVVTSEGVSWRSTARIELVKRLEVETLFGPLGIYKVKSSGRVPLVGPNSSEALLHVKEALSYYDVDLFLVDGAINRMIPFQHVDYVILATGASRTIDTKELLLEVKTIVKVLSLPKGRSGELKHLTGPISLEALRERRGKEVLVESPFHLLLINDYGSLFDLLNEGKVFLLRRPELICVALNPAYPERRVEGFRLAIVDFSGLKETLSKEIDAPCVDVLREEDLFCEILSARVKRGWAFTM